MPLFHSLVTSPHIASTCIVKHNGLALNFKVNTIFCGYLIMFDFSFVD